MLILRTAFLMSLMALVTGCLQQHDHSHEHGHSHTRHHGIAVPLFSDQKQAAYAELKLHDDKGDLELWLTIDEDGHSAFDLLLESKITVYFPKLAKTVVLKVRNQKNNEDEDGTANIRNKKTNYFIFPGDTGTDATFLIGKSFASEAIISFVADGKKYTTKPFILRPHTH